MTQSIPSQPFVQWRLAVVAGLCAGTVFLVLSMIYVTLVLGLSPWIIPRYLASLVLGERVVPPPTDFDAGVVFIGLVVNYILAILYAFILAFIIHRWGLLVGVIGGALFGAALYAINLYTFTFFFPWFFALHSLPFLLLTILFGAVAGGVYELLDYDDAPFLARSGPEGLQP
jgi:hypothetical protein